MKKFLIFLVLSLLLGLASTASAKVVPMEPSPNAEPGYLMRIPYYAMNEMMAEWEADPYHSVYGFYSSMGCSDISCTDFENHFHWCPAGGYNLHGFLCLDRSHGHSDLEYEDAELAASRGNPCPCHQR